MGGFSFVFILITFFILFFIFNPTDMAFKIAQNWQWSFARSDDVFRGRRTGHQLLLVPFTAKKVRGGDNKPASYAEWQDPVKKVGVTNWLNQNVESQLQQLGCVITKVEEAPRRANQFVLRGELLNLIRNTHEGKIAMRLHLKVGDKTLLSRIYTATCRTKGLQKPIGYEWTDMFVGRSSMAKADKAGTYLLDKAFAQVMDEVNGDLRRILPYLTPEAAIDTLPVAAD